MDLKLNGFVVLKNNFLKKKMTADYDIKFTEEFDIYTFSDVEEIIISVIECLAVICILLILSNVLHCNIYYIPLLLTLFSNKII